MGTPLDHIKEPIEKAHLPASLLLEKGLITDYQIGYNQYGVNKIRLVFEGGLALEVVGDKGRLGDSEGLINVVLFNSEP